jgi:hypothetical protein
MVIVLPACPVPMPAPADMDTLPVVPSKVNAGTDAAPTIVILDIPELKVMFAPATRESCPLEPLRL